MSLQAVIATLRHAFRVATADLRRKPDYMIIGAQKCGTTTLFNMLSRHPAVANPKNKEMHFFDDRDIHSVRHYRGMFPFEFKRLTGEATPAYLYYPHVPERIMGLFPTCKFIAILRNPVDRAYSHYQMRFRRGKEKLSFEDAIRSEEQRLAKARKSDRFQPRIHNPELLAHSYLDRGLYARQLKNWFRVFDREQICILSYEELAVDPLRVYGEMCSFLDLPLEDNATPETANKSNYPPMKPETRAMLEDFYENHNEELFELIDKRFDWNERCVQRQ